MPSLRGRRNRGRGRGARGIGERGEGTPATRTPFASFPPNDFQLSNYLIRQELSIYPPIKIRRAFFCMTDFTRECATCRQNKNSPNSFVKRPGKWLETFNKCDVSDANKNL